MWLHTLFAIEDSNSTIENTKASLHLYGEVHVAWCVNDVDLVVVPETGGGSGGNGDAALLLLRHPVHRGSTIVNLTDFVGNTRVKQNALCRRGLSRIDVGHDADVADLVQVS